MIPMYILYISATVVLVIAFNYYLLQVPDVQISLLNAFCISSPGILAPSNHCLVWIALRVCTIFPLPLQDVKRNR